MTDIPLNRLLNNMNDYWADHQKQLPLTEDTKENLKLETRSYKYPNRSIRKP
ncbi:MAG: hypothetical protein RL662_258 [Bacteroidota bacterium]|jgi:hypothetical protein